MQSTVQKYQETSGTKMTQKEWKQKAKPVLLCFVAGASTMEADALLFVQSCGGRGMWSPLFWRIPILLWAVTVTTLSLVYFWGPTPMFFLYLTHWSLILIMLESLFGTIVTIKKIHGGLPDATFGLPWYVKTYWVLYNIAVPTSFLVSVFYWGILIPSSTVINYAPDPVLDVMVHAVNSAVMLVELISSAHPSRLLHIMQPLYFALVYLLFTVAYYFAGGLDPWENPFIYPVLDWSKPNQTMVVTTLTALFLALMHLLVVAIATVRDAIARRFFKENDCIYNEELKA